MKHDPDFMQKINRDLAARRAAYRILDIGEDAGLEDVKRAYRNAAVRYHPDHNGNTTEVNRRFALIKCAYELLAFDKPCDEILAEINSWSSAPDDAAYRMDNPWGQFLWWREKFFGAEPDDKEGQSKGRSCI
jgi:hypothetical protein